MNLIVCPSCGPGSIRSHGGGFQGIHTLPTSPEPAWQKMAQSPLNGTTQPVDIEESWSPTTDRQWQKKI